eukprot:363917-Chlamydomonas_euryale.AAC.14
MRIAIPLHLGAAALCPPQQSLQARALAQDEGREGQGKGEGAGRGSREREQGEGAGRGSRDGKRFAFAVQAGSSHGATGAGRPVGQRSFRRREAQANATM